MIENEWCLLKFRIRAVYQNKKRGLLAWQITAPKSILKSHGHNFHLVNDFSPNLAIKIGESGRKISFKSSNSSNCFVTISRSTVSPLPVPSFDLWEEGNRPLELLTSDNGLFVFRNPYLSRSSSDRKSSQSHNEEALSFGDRPIDDLPDDHHQIGEIRSAILLINELLGKTPDLVLRIKEDGTLGARRRVITMVDV